MIFGIGSDLVEIDRIAKIELRSNGRFATKVLGCDEYLIYMAHKKKAQVAAFAYLAKRFAAKEAFSKAIGSGIRAPVTWKNIQTLSGENGKPMFFLSNGLARWVEQKKINFFVTLSDTRKMAIAFVIASKDS